MKTQPKGEARAVPASAKPAYFPNRASLLAAYEARGAHRAKLFFGYSPKLGKDVTLIGEAEHAHFVLVESDPSIIWVDYSPSERIINVRGDDICTRFDAELAFSDGSRQLREIKAEESESEDARTAAQREAQSLLAEIAGDEYVRLTLANLYENPLLIQNWNRVIHALDAWKMEPLIDEGNHNAKLLRAHCELSLEAIEREGEALFSNGFGSIVAALRQVQRGVYTSDLDSEPYGLRTRITVQAEGRS